MNRFGLNLQTKLFCTALIALQKPITHLSVIIFVHNSEINLCLLFWMEICPKFYYKTLAEMETIKIASSTSPTS
jgi:hypothetical protein